MSIFDSPPIKAEGTAITHNLSSGSGTVIYNTAGRYTPPSTQLSIKEGDRTIVVADMLLRLEYILQRTVPNYDELVEQFNAIRDIQRSNNDIR
jgi:hypothetical protein